jgi:EAL domain-containing protein (putative c-di-GMP-specific phosphodiesterase class I)
MKCADVAMYRAKDRGRNTYQFYTPDMNAKAHELFRLEGSLRKALEHDQLTLYYQPQIDVATGKIVGLEALIRWEHPNDGIILPGEFIHLAEETGLIVPIGEWVLRAACLQIKAWQESGYPPVHVAVNISGRQFRHVDLVRTVDQTLDETGVDPRLLSLEITESVIMHEVESTLETLYELTRMGVQLAIDDFGTGYSSLGYLKRFPIAKLKIDRSFIRDVTSNSNDAAIVSSIIALGLGMNMEVIAEGVETVEQLRFLSEKGCRIGQGYLFSEPLPPADVVRFLRGQD